MDAFSYLAVLISIILGLGIAQLLAGFGRWIEHRASFQSYAPATIWAGTLLLMHVQTWWSMFGMRLHAAWTFLQFAVVLLQPITLYLLAIVVLPAGESATVDLRARYYVQRRWLFGLLMFLLAVSVLKDLVVSGGLPSTPNLAFHGFLLLGAAGAFYTARTGYHQVLAYTAAAAMVVYIGGLFAQLR